MLLIASALTNRFFSCQQGALPRAPGIMIKWEEVLVAFRLPSASQSPPSSPQGPCNSGAVRGDPASQLLPALLHFLDWKYRRNEAPHAIKFYSRIFFLWDGGAEVLPDQHNPQQQEGGGVYGGYHPTPLLPPDLHRASSMVLGAFRLHTCCLWGDEGGLLCSALIWSVCSALIFWSDLISSILCPHWGSGPRSIRCLLMTTKSDKRRVTNGEWQINSREWDGKSEEVQILPNLWEHGGLLSELSSPGGSAGWGVLVCRAGGVLEGRAVFAALSPRGAGLLPGRISPQARRRHLLIPTSRLPTTASAPAARLSSQPTTNLEVCLHAPQMVLGEGPLSTFGSVWIHNIFLNLTLLLTHKITTFPHPPFSVDLTSKCCY